MPRKSLYSELLGEELSTSPNVVSKPVPNLLPKIYDQPYKLAIVGEAPGADEVVSGTPFVGYSGRDLTSDLSRFGFIRDACFIGNICQERPPGNKFAYFDWKGSEIQNGLARLREDLSKWRPNLCLLLGASALHAFRAPNITPRKSKAKQGELRFIYPFPIGLWRGTFFMSHPDSPCPNVKCVASYHPAACLRQYEFKPVLMLDIQRCVEQSRFPEWNPPLRNLKVSLSFEQTVFELKKILSEKPLTSTDIEGGVNTLSCISFATAADYAFIVPFTTLDGQSYWSTDEETALWLLVEQILGDPEIPKILQNGLYDRFVLQYSYHIVVRNAKDDTLLKNWELYCEMRKSLAFLASIYTWEPYWKEERLQAEQRDEEEKGEE